MSEANREEAQKLKAEGNKAYQKRAFEKATQLYNQAIELEPTEITYYTNLAAVHFETKDYEKCIQVCDKAIDVGRENRTALSEVESLLKKAAEEAYVDPAISEQEKQAGNDLFKKGDFGGAVKRYSEAIKRNPNDAKIYSNRAACYTKLMSFDLALADCEKAITLEPTFIKAYLRKAKVLQGMSQPSKAIAAYEKVLEMDPNCSEAIEGYKNCSIQSHNDPEETRKRAMKDPEVQAILADPAMRMILEQMQSDPQAISEHLKNPEIAQKFMKLRESGLISVAYK